MLLGTMPDEGLVTAKAAATTRATDFSIAAIMARGAGPPPQQEIPDGQYNLKKTIETVVL